MPPPDKDLLVLTLPDIVEVIRGEMTTLNALRDATLARSRSLTRACARCAS